MSREDFRVLVFDFCSSVLREVGLIWYALKAALPHQKKVLVVLLRCLSLRACVSRSLYQGLKVSRFKRAVMSQVLPSTEHRRHQSLGRRAGVPPACKKVHRGTVLMEGRCHLARSDPFSLPLTQAKLLVSLTTDAYVVLNVNVGPIWKIGQNSRFFFWLEFTRNQV